MIFNKKSIVSTLLLFAVFITFVLAPLQKTAYADSNGQTAIASNTIINAAFSGDSNGFSSDKLANWIDGYYTWIDKYSRGELPNIIENNLTAQSFHEEEGRNGYFAPGSGTTEAQFMTIRAFVMAYKATGKINWLDKAEALADQAIQVLYKNQEIPNTFDPNNLWIPHWLYNVKGDFASEQYYLDRQIHFENGTAVFSADHEARKIFSVRALDATLLWKNPFAEILGTQFSVKDYEKTGNEFTVHLNSSYTGDALAVYSDLGGPTIHKGELYEAWPIWRKLEPTETATAVDSLWWSYDSFKLLAEVTGSDKWNKALHAMKETIPYIINVNNLKDYLTMEPNTDDPFSTPGSYSYQNRTPAAAITRDRATGRVVMDIPEGNGVVQMGHGGMKETWSRPDMSVEVQLSSNRPNTIEFFIDPQTGYDENTRWRADLNLQGTGNQETFQLKREDFVRPKSFIWNMDYLADKSLENVYTSPNSNILLSFVNDAKGRKTRRIDFHRGTESGVWTETVTDADGNIQNIDHPYTYPGWAQYEIVWNKESLTLTSLPNIHYRSSGNINIRVEDNDGWIWKMPLPQSSNFTDFTPPMDALVINDWQQNNGTPPSRPAAPIRTIVFDAQDMNGSWVELGWLGNLETIPLNENISNIVLSAETPERQRIEVSHIRPLPLDTLNYVPYVAPFTVNLLDGKLSTWRGMPYAGYQAPYIWQELGNNQGVTTVLNFMKASQDAYQSKIGVRGPFAPVYLWDRWDSKEFGEPKTWTWNGPDPNTDWGGFQYRGAETVARTWYNDPQNTTAGQVTMDFIKFMNQSWDTYLKPIPGAFKDTGLPYGNGDEPHMAALLLRTSIYAYLAGGDTDVTLGLIKRCLMYLDKLYISPSDTNHPLLAGTWSPDPGNNVWYGFWGAEIINALSLLTIEGTPPQPGAVNVIF